MPQLYCLGNYVYIKKIMDSSLGSIDSFSWTKLKKLMERINSFPKVWKSKSISGEYVYVCLSVVNSMQWGLNTPLIFSGTMKLKYEDLV